MADVAGSRAKGSAQREQRILAPKRIRVNAIASASIEFPGGRWERARLNNLPKYHTIRARAAFGLGEISGAPHDVPAD
jgi:hypothetical protein